MASDPSQTWASAEAAERWQRTAAQRQQAVGAVTEQMLNSVDLQPGQHVLDLAAGTGDTTLLAAARVGRDGSVLAVDISETMLHQATLAAQRQGLTNVQTLVSDIVKLDLAPATFDVAISRFGLMFLSDIGEGLRRIRAALKSGARLAALVWSSEDKNPYIHIPREVAEHLQHASNERSSPSREAVSLGAPGVFERALVAAGFVSVSVQPLSTPREFESIDAAVEFMQDNSVVLRELLAELESAQHAQARAELRRHLTDFVQSDGHVVVPGEALLGIGTAP